MNTNYGRTGTTTESTATGPRAKCDQVVFEALCKACEMIVSSRGEPPASSTVSSRFNLTLPEHASVRQILQKWRRALHLPLRLDVYYQHDPSPSDGGATADAPPQRELLERWCLVYAPPSSEEWMQYQQQQQQQSSGYNKTVATNAVTLDPIVQLRQVCKTIVVWLRTLYCMARLLPATSFLHSKTSNVGFSLYAIAQGTDDDVQLQQQGFLCHPSGGTMQPSYVVGTPYGVLTWKVLTAEASVIHRLTGRTKQAWNFPTTTTTSYAVSRAIPIQSQMGDNHSHHSSSNNMSNSNGYEEVVEDDEDYQYHKQQKHLAEYGGVPQSAPAHFASPWPQHRQQQTAALQQQQHPSANAPKTYHQPSQFREHMARAPAQVLQRRHTSVGQESSGLYANDQSPSAKPAVPPKDDTKRVLSGLSLAMMTLEDKKNHDEAADSSIPDNGTADDSKEKRRAALHQAPPHRRSPQDDSAATKSPPSHHHHHHVQHYSQIPPPQAVIHRDTSQEYGYAYNSHIPWQKIHPSTTHPALQQRGDAEDSPGRAPTPSVLGSTPPPMLLHAGSHNSNPSSFGKQLLPPRSGSTTPVPLTPPFPNRPTGFAVNTDPPPMLQMQSEMGAVSPLQARPEAHFQADAMPQPLTSLDLLHQSPFLWNPNPHGSMLSSMTMPDSTMMDLKRSLLLTHQQPADVFASGGGGDWAEEMPFAVEDAAPATTTGSASGNPTTALEDLSSLGASTAVASLAQKCATSQRLQLFESKMGEGTTDALANQLADLRAFGASLVEGTSSSSSVVTNTTPTVLRA